MDHKIKDSDIPQFIAEIESRSNIWNFRKATSYKKKQKEFEEVVDKPGGRSAQQNGFCTCGAHEMEDYWCS